MSGTAPAGPTSTATSEGSRTRRPVTVTLVVVLQVVSTVIAAISAFNLIAYAFELSSGGITDRLATQLATEGITDIDPGMVAQGMFLAGVWLLTLAATRLLAAAYVALGRRWGRIVLAVLVTVSLIGGVAFLFQGFILRASLLVIVDLVLLWLLVDRRTSAFLAARSGP